MSSSNPKNLKAICLAIFVACHANSDPNLSTEDRLFDMESEIEILKEEVKSAKSLAEQERASAFNPKISVVGDIVGQVGFNMGHEHKEHGHSDHDHGHHDEFNDGMGVREIEVGLGADIDPYADGLVSVAFEPHGISSIHVHLEEAFIRIKQWPGLGFAPLGIRLKVGKFKASLGRMNRLHLHNAPQITYPMAMRTFLGPEGHAATGISLNTSFSPFLMGAINLFGEVVFNSRLPLQKEGAEKVPSGILHAWWHQELAPAHFLDVGASSLLGRKGMSGSGVFWLLAMDFHYSYIPPGYGLDPMFLFGNEFYTANKSKEPGLWPIGNFTWAQIRLFGSNFFGVRYEFVTKKNNFKDVRHSIGAYLTHYTSEFLRFRLGYEHVMPDFKSFQGDHRLMFSINFVLGSHPIEPYFINR